MAWTVSFTRKAAKQCEKLPQAVRNALALLAVEMEKAGPVRGNWPNYSKLTGSRHNCHLKKGNPTYVAVWREDSEGLKIVEVLYVGSHEKAPY